MRARLVEITISGGVRFPCLAFPCRAQKYAPTQDWGCESWYFRSVTHLATGKRIACGLSPRQARAVATVLDYILPEESEGELLAAFTSLPDSVRRWILSWRLPPIVASSEAGKSGAT